MVQYPVVDVNNEVASTNPRAWPDGSKDAQLTIYPDSVHCGVFQQRRTFVPEVFSLLAG